MPNHGILNDHGMTVGELIDFLQGFPRETLVVLSSDAEGNNHSPLRSADACLYEAQSSYSGQTYHTHEELDELIAAKTPYGYEWSEADRAPQSAVPVIELGPIN